MSKRRIGKTQYFKIYENNKVYYFKLKIYLYRYDANFHFEPIVKETFIRNRKKGKEVFIEKYESLTQDFKSSIQIAKRENKLKIYRRDDRSDNNKFN